MNITPSTLSFASLFQIGSETKYIVPEYQRHYSWKEEQIDTLYTDINNEETGYYVGNLLINNVDGNNSIIDGQQRLTTLSLLLLGIYANMKRIRQLPETKDNDPLYEELTEAMGDIKRQLLIDGDVSNPRIQLLDKDNEIFCEILKILNNENLVEGYGNFAFFKRYKFIQDTLLEDVDAETLLDYYKEKLIKITLLQILVPDLSDAYQVFRSLNSKGLPLTPLDLLKNIYLSKSGDVTKWQELLDIFSDGDQADEQKMTRFVLNNYDAFEMKSSQSLTKGQIVRKYQGLFDKQGERYIDQLIEHAKVYKEIDSSADDFTYSLSGLAKLDSTTCYPLMLNLIVNKEKYEIEDKIEDIIKLMINLFVRRNFVLTPKASNVRSACNSIRKFIVDEGLKGEELFAYFKKEIQQIMPSDDALKSALNDGVYDKNKKTTRFVLIMLERQFGKFFHKGNEDSLDEFSGGKLRWTIEHIVPQGALPDYWVEDIADGDSELAFELQQDNVHLLGNLTLTPYNSGMGQKPFSEKVNYRDPSNSAEVGFRLPLFLNESIDVDKKEFNITDIETRNSLLTNKVLELLNVG